MLGAETGDGHLLVNRDKYDVVRLHPHSFHTLVELHELVLPLSSPSVRTMTTFVARSVLSRWRSSPISSSKLSYKRVEPPTSLSVSGHVECMSWNVPTTAQTKCERGHVHHVALAKTPPIRHIAASPCPIESFASTNPSGRTSIPTLTKTLLYDERPKTEQNASPPLRLFRAHGTPFPAKNPQTM